MNLTVFACGSLVFTNCECIHGYAFKAGLPRDNYALKTIVSAVSRYIYALFDVRPGLSKYKPIS